MDTRDLTAELGRLLPSAITWAEGQAEVLQREGAGLSIADQDLARAVGVKHPDRVRVCLVRRIPAPSDPLLSRACAQLGFLGPDTAGLTLGYGVYLRTGLGRHEHTVLAHELRHVAQYESRESIGAYLNVYIPELLEYGYEHAPFEIDARRAEVAARRGRQPS